MCTKNNAKLTPMAESRRHWLRLDKRTEFQQSGGGIACHDVNVRLLPSRFTMLR